MSHRCLTTMNREHLAALIISGGAGIMTSILHMMQSGAKQTVGKVTLQFAVGACAIYVGYMIGEWFDLDRETLLVVGYICGLLGDRVIQEIYRRENDIYNYFVGGRVLKLDDKLDKTEGE